MKKINKPKLKYALQTVLLIAVIIAGYVEINILVNKLNFKDIDLTKNKLFSVSSETIDKLKGLENDVTIEIVNITNANDVVSIAMQYPEITDKVKVKVLNSISEDEEMKSKYQLQDDSSVVIVKSNDNEKVLGVNSFYTYEYTSNSYQEVNMAEEVLTNTIINITTKDRAKIYFPSTHTPYTREYFASLIKSIEDDAGKVEFINIAEVGAIPEDCKCLVIPTMTEDFTNQETEAIKQYINKGGNIILLQDFGVGSLKNLQSIMDLYGFNLSNGVLLEGTKENMVNARPNYVVYTANNETSLTKKLNMNLKACLFDARAIAFKNEDELKNINVSYEPLIKSSENAFVRSNLNIQDLTKQAEDVDAKGAILAAIVDKKINENVSSKMIVYGNGLFATNAKIMVGSSTEKQSAAIKFYNNKDLVVNSINYLAGTDNNITIRKKYGDSVNFKITEAQSRGIIELIYGIPMILIIVGYIVWRVRKNRK